MRVVYHPEGSEEPTYFDYDPKRFHSGECEAIERVTGMNFGEWERAVRKGSAKARRALLWVLLKRQHPTLAHKSVEFRWCELDVEASKADIRGMLEMLDSSPELSPEDRALARVELEKQLEDAYEDDSECDGEGK